MMNLISSGSPWTFIVLALMGISIVFSLVAPVASIAKGKLVPLVVWLIVPALIIVLGSVGTWVQAGRVAEAEHLRQIAHATALSLNLELLAYLCASLCLLLAATAVSFSSVLGSKSTRGNRKATPLAAAISVVFGGMAFVGFVGYSSLGHGGTGPILLKLVLMWAIAACVAVNLLKEVEDSSHAFRRFHVAVLIGLSLVSFSAFSYVLGEVELFEALEKASLENRLPLIHHGLDLARKDWVTGLVAVGGVAFFGLLPALLFVRELLSRRAAVEVVSASVGILITLFGLAGLRGLTEARHDVKLPQEALSLRSSIQSVSIEELELPERIKHLWLDRVPAGDCIIHRHEGAWRLASGFAARDTCAVGDCKSGPLIGLCPGLERPMLLIEASESAHELSTQSWANGRTIVLGLDQQFKIDPGTIPRRYLHFAAPPSGVELSFHQGHPTSDLHVVSGDAGGFTFTSPEKVAASLDADGLFKLLSTRKAVFVPAPHWTIKDLVEACVIWDGKVYLEEPQPLSCEVWTSIP